ncbi:LptF/LptG family permease [Spirochaeta thermophila]|uniref:Permease YjgP/YjgQ family protein n=1 Tax=Winmispira thermophila (strain ATCC 49972 / DSM 6192 / RI 19.B1) TaxID=665571 RepID=E0RSS0_WINT6|nr:LptF/LptG family permease [Spirochaeta thermophila]ADN02057.1 hypothetical protein STHERM_c11120 [Spirochaeta thermophila DSM 6192]
MTRRSYLTLYRYVGEEIALSFVISFLFFFVIFLINQFLLMAEQILSKRAPLFDVILLIIYALPSIVAISVPFASLAAALMSITRLSSDNEFLAFQAGGISLVHAFLPMVVFSLLLSSVSFVANDYFLPLGTLNFAKLYRQILYTTPEIELESYAIKEYQNTILIPGKVNQSHIDDLLIIEETEEGTRILQAREGDIVPGRNEKTALALELHDVFLSLVKREGDYEYSSAETLTYTILVKDINIALRNPGPREMSSVDVYRVMKEREQVLEQKRRSHEKERDDLRRSVSRLYLTTLSLSNESIRSRFLGSLRSSLQRLRQKERITIEDRTLQIYTLEFHKKFSIPFSCIPFVLLAIAIGLFNLKGGRAAGFGIGIFLSILYWGMLVAGQMLGLRTSFSPSLAMWLPNILITLVALTLFLVRKVRR